MQNNVKWLPLLRRYKQGLKSRHRLGMYHVSPWSYADWTDTETLLQAMRNENYDPKWIQTLSKHFASRKTFWRDVDCACVNLPWLCHTCACAAIDRFFQVQGKSLRKELYKEEMK